MRSRWERAFTLGLGALLLGLALAAQLLQPSGSAEPGSAASAAPDGRRALLLLLRESGLRADAWDEAPAALPRGGALLWLARVPDRAGSEAGEDGKPAPADVGLRADAHYRRFVEEGGVLLLPEGKEARKFLVERLGLEACGEVEARDDSEAGLHSFRDDPAFRDEPGGTLEVEVRKGGTLRLPGAGSKATARWVEEGTGAGPGGALAVEVRIGRGRVVLLGDDGFLDNSRIGEHDHAPAALFLARELAPDRRVLFDEYALGLWRPHSPVAILASPGFFLATLHLLLLLALLVVASAWVREFPRDAPRTASLSPLERARSLAALLARAGRYGLLARLLREGIARRLQDRAGGVDRASAARLAELGRVRCASAEDLERLHAALRAIERAPVDSPAPAR